MKKIVEINWNWQAGLMEGNSDRMDSYPDTCETAKVGINGVRSIEKIETSHETYWEVNYDSKIVQIFNPNTIVINK
jgi:hypothetical protein